MGPKAGICSRARKEPAGASIARQVGKAYLSVSRFEQADADGVYELACLRLELSEWKKM